ncbi:MAG TPA: sulfatase-like hydrolase/transferase [Acidobacteriaceae bacterium]|nr:sulfatase-like hydrolase/transferase [Acidobacteriaceae bacterium]
MERREFLKAASLTAAGAMLPANSGWGESSQAAPVTKPNIIFCVSDQHRAGLTKRSGYPLDTSPTLDKLADAGIGFDRAYCTTPLCVPSRTSMLTGRWPEATHVRMNLDPQDAYYTKHLYQVAKEQGYRTGLAGKNHTFLKKDSLDFWRQYGHWFGWRPANAPREYLEYDKWMAKLEAEPALTPTPFPVEVSYPYRIVSDAIDFIDQSGSTPFILQVGFPEPHDPEQVPKPYWDMFPPDSVPGRCAGPEALKHLGYRAQWLYGLSNDSYPSEKYWRRYKSNYLGMLRLLDDQLARLVSHLEQKDILKNTVIVYLADHGDYLMDYGLARKGVGLFECLTRIPMVWSGYGVKPTSVGSSAFTSMADVMPTMCEIMGAEIPEGVQGRSLWPLLRGEDYPREEFRSIYTTVGLGGLYYEASDHVPYSTAERHIAKGEGPKSPYGVGWDELDRVTQSGLQKMVRMGDWKLIYDMMGYGQLYNLASDPCELKNLFGQPQVATEQARLMAELLMWTIRCQDSLPTGPQNWKYQTKWPKKHNWYAPYRHGTAPEAFIP